MRDTRIGVLAAVLLLGTAACSSPSDVDGFGPNAGFAEIEGTLFHGDGSVAPGEQVSLTMCDLIVTGVPADTTDAAGGFRLEHQLGPVGGIRPSTRRALEADGSVTGTCVLAVDFGRIRKEIEVTYYRERSGIVPVVVAVVTDSVSAGDG